MFIGFNVSPVEYTLLTSPYKIISCTISLTRFIGIENPIPIEQNSPKLEEKQPVLDLE